METVKETPADQKDPATIENTGGATDDQVVDQATELVRRRKQSAPPPPDATPEPADLADVFDAALPDGALRLPIADRTAQRIMSRQSTIATLQQQIESEQRAIDDIAGTVKDSTDVDGNFVVVGIDTRAKGKPVLQLVPAKKIGEFQQRLRATGTTRA